MSSIKINLIHYISILINDKILVHTGVNLINSQINSGRPLYINKKLSRTYPSLTNIFTFIRRSKLKLVLFT